MDLQFAGNVTSVGDYGVYGNEKVFGYFLVRHSLHKAYYNILLAVGEGFAVVGISFEHHVGDVLGHVVFLLLLLKVAYGRHENLVLHLGMKLQPFLVVVYSVECGCKFVVALNVAGKIFYDDVFQFAQFLVCLSVVF